jgi:hypothetical protein
MPTPRVTPEGMTLVELLKKLAAEGLEVAQAELDLARAEAAGVTKIYVTGAVICVACFMVATATVVMLSEAMALGLEPYFNSPATAHLITALAMSLLAIFLAWLAVKFFTRKYQPIGAIFKWLYGQRKTS